MHGGRRHRRVRSRRLPQPVSEVTKTESDEVDISDWVWIEQEQPLLLRNTLEKATSYFQSLPHHALYLEFAHRCRSFDEASTSSKQQAIDAAEICEREVSLFAVSLKNIREGVFEEGGGDTDAMMWAIRHCHQSIRDIDREGTRVVDSYNSLIVLGRNLLVTVLALLAASESEEQARKDNPLAPLVPRPPIPAWSLSGTLTSLALTPVTAATNAATAASGVVEALTHAPNAAASGVIEVVTGVVAGLKRHQVGTEAQLRAVAEALELAVGVAEQVYEEVREMQHVCRGCGLGLQLCQDSMEDMEELGGEPEPELHGVVRNLERGVGALQHFADTLTATPSNLHCERRLHLDTNSDNKTQRGRRSRAASGAAATVPASAASSALFSRAAPVGRQRRGSQ